MTEEERSVSFGGFRTGRGKSVVVSDEAVEKAKSLGILQDEEFAVQYQQEAQAQVFSGFSTGKGKKVKITSEALLRATRIIEQEIVVDDVSSENRAAEMSRDIQFQEDSVLNSPGIASSNSSFVGFSTGRGKAVIVSNESKQKAAKILNECSSQNSIDESIEVSPVHFQTPLKKNPEIVHRKTSVNTITPVRSMNALLKSTPYKTPDLLCSKLIQKKSKGPAIFSPNVRAIKIPNSKQIQDVSLSEKKVKKSLSNYVNGSIPGKFSNNDLLSLENFPADSINISSRNSRDYKFQSSLGWKEAHSILKETYPRFQFDEIWTQNHYRWIVWKAASLCRSFPNNFVHVFSFQYVLDQLKNRYEIEHEQGKSSAVKKILQRDDFPSRLMVMLLSGIETCSGVDCTGCIELSDGWYSVKSIPDKHLHDVIWKGGIQVGHKIRIFGAAFSSDSIPCTPLENSQSKLKIFYNGTSRAKWDTKLGFQKCRLFRVSPSQILPDGGCLPMIRLLVQRVFPICFLEKQQNGQRILRNRIAEWECEEKHSALLQTYANMLFECKSTQKCSKRGPSFDLVKEEHKEALISIWEDMQKENDFNIIQAFNLCPSLQRKVTPFLRMICSSVDGKPVDYIEVTVWDFPHSSSLDVSEGACLDFFGSSVSRSSSTLCISSSCRKGMPFIIKDICNISSVFRFKRRVFVSNDYLYCVKPSEIFDYEGIVRHFEFESFHQKADAMAIFMNNVIDGSLLKVMINRTECSNVFTEKCLISSKIRFKNIRYTSFDSKYQIHNAHATSYSIATVVEKHANCSQISSLNHYLENACSIRLNGRFFLNLNVRFSNNCFTFDDGMHSINLKLTNDQILFILSSARRYFADTIPQSCKLCMDMAKCFALGHLYENIRILDDFNCFLSHLTFAQKAFLQTELSGITFKVHITSKHDNYAEISSLEHQPSLEQEYLRQLESFIL